jgi:hypothetical protein
VPTSTASTATLLQKEKTCKTAYYYAVDNAVDIPLLRSIKTCLQSMMRSSTARTKCLQICALLPLRSMRSVFYGVLLRSGLGGAVV